MTRAETKIADAKAARERLAELLRGQNKKGRFMTEVYAALERFQISAVETDCALAEMEAEGVIMVRENFCADPHLAGVNLRIAAIVDSADGAQAEMNAIREIDSAWDKWLSSYLANHRCS